MNKFTIFRDLCRFLQPRLISYMRFDEKLGHTHLNHKRIYIYVTDLIPNDWKHKLEQKLLKNPSSRFFVLTIKVLGK